MEIRNLIFIGDIHGELRELVWNATSKYELSNSDLVVLGDFGVGFDKGFDTLYARVAPKLEKADLHIYTLRGNHDDPSWFDGSKEGLYPRVSFLQDHHVYEIAGKKCYIIGGAGSTDISWRLKEKKKVWWEDEYVKELPIKDLPGKVDIILSHEAPLAFEPVISRFSETPEWQYEKILAGRTYLSQVLQEITTEYWYYGHYHNHFSGSYGQVIYRGLGIMEFYEHH